MDILLIQIIITALISDKLYMSSIGVFEPTGLYIYLHDQFCKQITQKYRRKLHN